MKIKGLILLVLLSSLFGYFSWGVDNQQFLFEVEMEILKKSWVDPLSVLHPFTLLPFIGQLLLFISLFQNRPKKWMIYGGLIGLSLIMLMLLLIGILNVDLKIGGSALPFLISAYLLVRAIRSTYPLANCLFP